MLILAVTSATASVGVAVVDVVADAGSAGAPPVAFTVLAERQTATDRRHAEELTPMIADALARAGAARGAIVRLADIDRFAVDIGPGRFTGLRVGLATVRTLALATSTPATGVSSLEALAAEFPGATVTAIVDARRAEVFQQRFSVDVAGVPTALCEPLVGEPARFVVEVADHDVVVGDGGDRYAELYGRRLVSGREPSPVTIARLASARPGVEGSLVRPRYLRDPDVQINIKTRAIATDRQPS